MEKGVMGETFTISLLHEFLNCIHNINTWGRGGY